LQPNVNQNSTTLEIDGLKTRQLAGVVGKWWVADFNQTATTLADVIFCLDQESTARLKNGCKQNATTLAGEHSSPCGARLDAGAICRALPVAGAGIQEWHQGRRKPEPAVRAYMPVIRNQPAAACP
jgi:hypothetical protein